MLPAPHVGDPQSQLNFEWLSKYLIVGKGSPEGKVTAAHPALYLRLDGGASTSLYVKESGSSSTGWVAK
jgi:hypothetical protein